MEAHIVGKPIKLQWFQSTEREQYSLSLKPLALPLSFPSVAEGRVAAVSAASFRGEGGSGSGIKRMVDISM